MACEAIVARLVVAFRENFEVGLDELFWCVVGGVARAEGEVQKKRFRRGHRLLVANKIDGPVDEILAQVVVRRVRFVDAMVVAGEFGKPVIGLAIEKTVEAIKALLAWRS